MQEIIHELFTEEELKIFDEERINLSLKKIIGDLENRKINFYSLGNDQLYREILPRYFKWQGYGHLSSSSLHILKDYMLKDRDLADINLAILLLDTGIIDKIPVSEKNPLDTDNVIKYKRSKGLKEKITISYDILDRFPFYIKEVQCGHKNIISIQVDNEGSKKKVTLDIDIPANDHVTYNFTESLIIYTDFEIKTIDFSIVCDTTLPNNVTKSIDDFDSFLKLVKINRKSARSIFSNEDGFKAFLEQSGDIEQILNYEDCKQISKEIETYPFSLFCDINEINKDLLFKETFNSKKILALQPDNIEEKNIAKEEANKEKVVQEIVVSNKTKVKEKNEDLSVQQSSNSNMGKNRDSSANKEQNVKKDIIKNDFIKEKNIEEIKEELSVNKKSKEDDSLIKDKCVLKEDKEESLNEESNQMDIQKEDSRTISLEYTGKVESVKENKIKYSKELLDKSKNKKEEKSNIVDYNQIKNKKEEKKLVDFNDKSESLENTKEKENDLNKENIKNQVKIKKADDKHLENEGLEDFKVKELQRDSKYRITRKEEKDENKKDMNIIWKIKQMLKGFKRS
mgnify:CR=1 FL=1